MTDKKNIEDRSILPIMGIALLVVGAAMLIEMSFQLSTVSFLSKQIPLNIVMIAINSLAILLLPALFLSIILKILFLALRNRLKAIHVTKTAILFVFFLVMTIIASSHLNTWSYSIFGHDVTDIRAVINWIILLCIALLGLYLTFARGLELYAFFVKHQRLVTVICSVSFLVLFISVINKIKSPDAYIKSNINTGMTKKELPNIVLFSGDGMDIDHMSLYGYDRKTTPTMDMLGERSTIYTRAYSNADNTRGSIISVLTGKLPTTTKVIYPPDILTGANAFQHLPGILSNLGYHCISFDDAGEYVSARKTNMQFAFHNENGKESWLFHNNPLYVWAARQFQMELFHISAIIERPVNFIGYLAGLSRQLLYSKEKFRHLQGARETYLSTAEEATYRKILAGIGKINKPVFIQVHSIKSHGPRFQGIKKSFSAGKTLGKDWSPDLYDDAILHVDYMLWLLLQTLKQTGKLENTLIIIYTDHVNRYRPTFQDIYEVPLPLLVHLPGQRTKKTIDKPVQYLDLFPSVLSYIGVEPPTWAEGKPIFPFGEKEDLDNRPIFLFAALEDFVVIGNRGWVVKKAFGPPYYGFRIASILKNGVLYKLNLYKNESFLYNTATSAHSPELLASEGISIKLRGILLRHLQNKGFDISAINDNYIVKNKQ
jgi:hypothetical protein